MLQDLKAEIAIKTAAKPLNYENCTNSTATAVFCMQ